MRASGKWELYEPLPKSTHLDKILKATEEDKYGCFLDEVILHYSCALIDQLLGNGD